MNKRLILFSVLIIFLVGMTIGCIAVEIFEIKPEQDKYVSKESGKTRLKFMHGSHHLIKKLIFLHIKMSKLSTKKIMPPQFFMKTMKIKKQ